MEDRDAFALILHEQMSPYATFS